MKRLYAAWFFLIFFLPLAGALETAEKYFDRISDYYGSIRDYEGDLVISQGNTEQSARISYKSPNKLRLDFSNPEGQVLNVNDEKLELYLPAPYFVAFVQPLKSHTQSSLAGMANAQGLDLMKENYSIAYLRGPGTVPLYEGSQEKVTKLRLTWRSTSEGFRELLVSVGKNKLIRRIEGLTVTMDKVIFDFTNIAVNVDIPDARFDYHSPPEGNSIENFLFEPEG